MSLIFHDAKARDREIGDMLWLNMWNNCAICSGGNKRDSELAA